MSDAEIGHRPVSILEDLLPKAERRAIYRNGHQVGRDDWREGMILVSKTGRFRRFDRIDGKRWSRKRYVWFDSGVHTGFGAVERAYRDATPLLTDRGDVPEGVLPEWIR